MGQYIPSGRTSVVNKAGADYQLQTEYARLPHPRITTTISVQGRVLHKIESRLASEVNSPEQMHDAETRIKSQHIEVARILREQGVAALQSSESLPSPSRNRQEMMQQIEEVERAYAVSPEGDLIGDKKTTQRFRQMFKHIFRELPEMLNVFAALPGDTGRREEGIYEIEPGRILLISIGREFYLVLVKPGTPYGLIAPKLRAVFSTPQV